MLCSTKLQSPCELKLPHYYLEVVSILLPWHSKVWSKGLKLILLSLRYISVFFPDRIVFLLSDNSSFINSSNFWVPFTLWEIGLVVSNFSRISFIFHVCFQVLTQVYNILIQYHPLTDRTASLYHHSTESQLGY